MRLVEQPMPQSYHLQDNDWTPLSQNPCWQRWYSPWPMFVYNDNLRVNIICQNNFYVGQVKSFVDDLKGTEYCKHESSLCATICWGSALVPAICARLRHSNQYNIDVISSDPCHFSSPHTTNHTKSIGRLQWETQPRTPTTNNNSLTVEPNQGHLSLPPMADWGGLFICPCTILRVLTYILL